MTQEERLNYVTIMAGMLLIPHPATGRPASREMIKESLGSIPADYFDELFSEAEVLLQDQEFRRMLLNNLTNKWMPKDSNS